MKSICIIHGRLYFNARPREYATRDSIESGNANVELITPPRGRGSRQSEPVSYFALYLCNIPLKYDRDFFPVVNSLANIAKLVCLASRLCYCYRI